MREFKHKLETYNKITLVRIIHQLLLLDFDDANDNHLNLFALNRKDMIDLINRLNRCRIESSSEKEKEK